MLKRIFAAALLVCGLSVCSSAKADSYTFSIVGIANSNYFVAGNDFGDYEVHLGQPSLNCGTNASTCFGTHIAATNTTTYSTTQMMLVNDPSPTAGSGCTYSGPATTTLCTNGHEVVYGLNGDFRLYTVTGQTLSPTGYNGGFQYAIQSANGNLFFSDTVNENLIVGLNRVTPEPSSLALLGTGVLGLLGATRRRFAA